jgi:cyclohexanecarboxylate-CoA ligase
MRTEPLQVATVAEALDAGRARFGATEVEFSTAAGSTTFRLAELAADAGRLAGGLAGEGIGPGDRVAGLLPNGRDAFVLELAAARLAATLVPMVPLLGSPELAQIVADSSPALLIHAPRWRKNDLNARVATLDGNTRRIETGSPEWSELFGAEAPPPHIPAPRDECLVIYTSGSTGVPKGVRHSHRAVLAEAVLPPYRATMTDADLALQASAAGHIGGYLYPLRILLMGSRTIVMDGWDAERAARLIADRRISALPATPFHLAAILDVADRDGLDVSCLQYVVVGGAPCPPELVERADRHGVRAVRSFGMSEHPTITLGDHAAPLAERASCDGRVARGNEVSLVDEAGRPAAPGAAGEIRTRGPERFIGYTNAGPRALAAEEWFSTGDIGRVDSRGLLTVVDRKKNIIIRGGENLSASEIELVLGRHPAVAEVAVVGVPDERYGERACAFVVLAAGHTLDLGDVRRHFADQGVGIQKTPEHLRLVDQLPRSAIQKVRKQELRQLFLADAGPGGVRPA